MAMRREAREKDKETKMKKDSPTRVFLRSCRAGIDIICPERESVRNCENFFHRSRLSVAAGGTAQRTQLARRGDQIPAICNRRARFDRSPGHSLFIASRPSLSWRFQAIPCAECG